MIKKVILITALLTFNLTSHAEGPPLVVAVDNFAPPFVLRANQQFYGFDIATMEELCRLVKRTCRYQPMAFSKLLEAVANNQAEAAIGAITITAQRAQLVNFTLPYMLSHARFITSAAAATQPFSYSMMDNKKIGVEEGSAFPLAIKTMGIINPQIVEYKNEETIIEELYNGNIDFALLDGPTALYWQSQSSDKLAVIGEQFTYGYGFGIAVNKGNTTLLAELNQAIQQYEKSEMYRSNYDKYLSSF
ncbi:transporter substrate-binding domain-containing protein [Legionella dresdenensis]|uniref:Transporter substrate-binding domain-containing protein n=1 Tax=Legionella dresdenensis TaxID=450200 RepID=A0ABV8CEG2_9GAMM